jgi:deoxyribonuclease V
LSSRVNTGSGNQKAGLDPLLYNRLCRIQEALSKRVVVSDEWLGSIQRVAGVDAAYREDLAAVGFSVYSIPENRIVLISVARTLSKMPYVSSLLCFKEGPVVLKMLRRFAEDYDLLMVNGHGLAHPRRCGLATYLGIMLKKPVIGVAKKPLGEPGAEHNVNNLRMFEDKYYYSVGNMITLEGAFSILRRTTPGGFKLPIPLEAAHKFSVKMLREMVENAERV